MVRWQQRGAIDPLTVGKGYGWKSLLLLQFELSLFQPACGWQARSELWGLFYLFSMRVTSRRVRSDSCHAREEVSGPDRPWCRPNKTDGFGRWSVFFDCAPSRGTCPPNRLAPTNSFALQSKQSVTWLETDPPRKSELITPHLSFHLVSNFQYQAFNRLSMKILTKCQKVRKMDAIWWQLEVGSEIIRPLQIKIPLQLYVGWMASSLICVNWYAFCSSMSQVNRSTCQDHAGSGQKKNHSNT